MRGGHSSAGRVRPSPRWQRALEERAAVREGLEAMSGHMGLISEWDGTPLQMKAEVSQARSRRH